MHHSDLVKTPLQPADLRGLLREATTAAHDALDRHFETMIDEPALATYRAFLRMNHACHAALEAWIVPAIPADIAADRPVFTDALAADLAAMEIPALPAPHPFEGETADLAAAAGILYVLDGSRLGARVLVRPLAARRAAREEAIALTYLTAAAAPGPVFAAFNAVSARLEDDDVARVLDTARKTFDYFGSTAARAATAI
ncbi:biliverdin-producing heme oxygenase [Acuticoccus kandeliae]|uniref:biliverdin-producing heme oxygenase n=1 Tax=Acuticoccus kandeliae TaxID=2073160 RepID=UPI000D3ECAEF|nr:biliverdin-producing heme oxygenase [Acuticoccus kandeliae]